MFLCFVDFFLGHVNSNITIIQNEKYFNIYCILSHVVLRSKRYN